MRHWVRAALLRITGSRYRAGKPMLEAGVHSSDEMFQVMRAMRATSGETRKPWTSVIDLKRLAYHIRYVKEDGQKYELVFGPRIWFNTIPSSSRPIRPGFRN